MIIVQKQSIEFWGVQMQLNVVKQIDMFMVFHNANGQLPKTFSQSNQKGIQIVKKKKVKWPLGRCELIHSQYKTSWGNQLSVPTMQRDEIPQNDQNCKIKKISEWIKVADLVIIELFGCQWKIIVLND